MSKIILFIFSSSMIFMKNQMVMVTFIIFLCTMLAAWMFLISNIHWFSVLMLLIYVSGIMVLFMFIVSLSPNEKSPIKMKKPMMMMMILSMVFMSKTMMEYENLKINSSIEWSPSMMMLTLTTISLMAYLPPKTMKSFYSGMKSTK